MVILSSVACVAAWFCHFWQPTSEAVLGDTVKIGRRGSLSGTLTVLGVQASCYCPLWLLLQLLSCCRSCRLLPLLL